MRLEAPGRPDIDITATPCRHGPPFSRLITGDVIGFALRWDGQAHGVVWISGDSVLYDGIREVADRLMIDTAVLHLDGVRVPVSGRVRRTMTGPTGPSCAACCARARDPGPLRGLDALFGDGRNEVERAFAGSPDNDRLRWLPIADRVELRA